MKNILLAVFFIISATLKGAVYLPQPDPLMKFTEIAEQHNLTSTNWEVSLKETIKVKNPHTYVNKFRMYEYKASTKDKNSIKYLFEAQTKNNAIKTHYSIIVPEENQNIIELTAVIKGNGWDEDIKKTYLDLSEKMDKTFFSADARRFACLELIDDGTIEDSMIIEPYISSLELEVLDIQYDNVENSTLNKIYYGYTPLWKDFFSVDGAPLNLQIAITELENGDLSYKIGTPILINEY